MTRRRLSISLVVLATLGSLTLTACGGAGASWEGAGPVAVPSTDVSVEGTGETGLSSTTAPTPSAAPAPTAPKAALAVGSRTLNLSRGSARPLPTVVWYPATGKSGGAVKPSAAVAPGRFPIVLFSHGLHGLPEYYQQITTRFAAAGFVVAAPAYPFTNNKTKSFNVGDMGNQPTDGSYVITELLKLDTKSGDPLFGHLDVAHIGAAGHSAGGFTTAGMLGGKRDNRLKAGIVIAGGSMGAFKGPSAAVLFVHGDKDPTVTYATGRSSYGSVPWPKAFVTALGQGHGEYLGVGAKGFDQMMKTMIDFLRWSLYGDAGAKGRLRGDGAKSGVTAYESVKI